MHVTACQSERINVNQLLPLDQVITSVSPRHWLPRSVLHFPGTRESKRFEWLVVIVTDRQRSGEG